MREDGRSQNNRTVGAGSLSLEMIGPMAVLGRNVASALAPLSSHLPLVSVPPTRSRLLSPLAPTPISYPQSTNTIDLMRNRRDAEGLYFECSNGAGSLVGPCMKAHRQHDSQVTTSSPCVNFVRFEAHAMWFCGNLSLSCRARAVGCTSWVMEHGFYAPSTRFASVSLWSACRGVHVVGHGTWVLRSLDTLRFCFFLSGARAAGPMFQARVTLCLYCRLWRAIFKNHGIVHMHDIFRFTMHDLLAQHTIS